jgi:hypothetical protein
LTDKRARIKNSEVQTASHSPVIGLLEIAAAGIVLRFEKQLPFIPLFAKQAS